MCDCQLAATAQQAQSTQYPNFVEARAPSKLSTKECYFFERVDLKFCCDEHCLIGISQLSLTTLLLRGGISSTAEGLKK